MGVSLGYLLSRIDIVSTSNHALVVSINLFVALLCACIVLGHLLEENRWMNESITALLIGLCTGITIILVTAGGTSSHLHIPVPPTIFNAGFQVKKKQLFRNFMTITFCWCNWYSDILCHHFIWKPSHPLKLPHQRGCWIFVAEIIGYLMNKNRRYNTFDEAEVVFGHC